MGQLQTKFGDRLELLHWVVASRTELEELCRSIYVPDFPLKKLFALTQTLIDDYDVNDELALLKLSECFTGMTAPVVLFEDFVLYAGRIFRCIADGLPSEPLYPSVVRMDSSPSFGQTSDISGSRNLPAVEMTRSPRISGVSNASASNAVRYDPSPPFLADKNLHTEGPFPPVGNMRSRDESCSRRQGLDETLKATPEDRYSARFGGSLQADTKERNGRGNDYLNSSHPALHDRSACPQSEPRRLEGHNHHLLEEMRNRAAKAEEEVAACRRDRLLIRAERDAAKTQYDAIEEELASLRVKHRESLALVEKMQQERGDATRTAARQRDADLENYQRTLKMEAVTAARKTREIEESSQGRIEEIRRSSASAMEDCRRQSREELDGVRRAVARKCAQVAELEGNASHLAQQLKQSELDAAEELAKQRDASQLKLRHEIVCNTELQAMVDRKSTELETAREELREAEHKVHTRDVEISATKDHNKVLADSVARLEERAGEDSLQWKDLGRELAYYKEKHPAMAKQEAIVRRECEGLAEAKAHLENQVVELQRRNDSVSQSAMRLRCEVADAQEQVNAQAHQLHSLQYQLAQRTRNMDAGHLCARTMDAGNVYVRNMDAGNVCGQSNDCGEQITPELYGHPVVFKAKDIPASSTRSGSRDPSTSSSTGRLSPAYASLPHPPRPFVTAKPGRVFSTSPVRTVPHRRTASRNSNMTLRKGLTHSATEERLAPVGTTFRDQGAKVQRPRNPELYTAAQIPELDTARYLQIPCDQSTAQRFEVTY